MQIFMAPTHRNRYIYYFEGEPGLEDVNTPPSQPNGRLQRLKAKLLDSYKRLEKIRPMAERVCSWLRKEENIEIIYPDGMPEAQVRKTFFNFLKSQVKEERSWKNRDAVLACLGAPLFFLPGPNIMFYYPAVRALGHYYAEAGCKKFLSVVENTDQHKRIRFTPSDELGELNRMVNTQGTKRVDRKRVMQIGRSLGLSALHSLYG